MGARGSKHGLNRASHESIKRSREAELLDISNMSQVIDMCEWEFGQATSSGMLAETLQGFAAVRAYEKNFGDAEAYQEEALPLLKKSFGKDHATVAECLLSVAQARCSLGRLENTLQEWRGANTVATTKFNDALDYAQKAFELYQKYNGKDQAKHLVRCHIQIGDAALLLENGPLALETWKTARNQCKALEPAEPMLMGLAAFGFAQATRLAGDVSPQLCIELLQEALKALQASDNSKTLADCYVDLATLYTSVDRHDETIDCLKKTVDIRQELFGDHEETADAICLLAESMYSRGDYFDSSQMSGKALQMYTTVLGNNNPKYAKSLSNIALAYYSQPNKLDDSMSYYEKGLQCFCTCLGTTHFAVGDTYNSMGSVRFAQKNTLEAMEFYSKALEIYLNIYGEEHASVAISYNNMGCVRRLENRLREAAEFYRKALDIRSKILGQDHKNTGLTMNALGEVELERKQYNEAMAMFTQARFIMAKSLGPDHPTVAKVTSNMGEASHGRGQYAAAMQNFSQSLDIRKKHLGENHPEVIALLKTMEEIQRQMLQEQQEAEKALQERRKSKHDALHDKDKDTSNTSKETNAKSPVKA